MSGIFGPKCTAISIGADPELFLQNPNDGGFVSAHKYVKGTKEEPWPVHHGAVQVDGVAAEFNIAPAYSAEQFVKNIRTVMDELKTMTIGSGYRLAIEPVADFDPKYFDNEVPADAKRLGCNPDYNAWELRVNKAPDARGQYFRTASGHVHVGWCVGADSQDPDHFELAAKVARQLDYALGIQSLRWDRDNRRRELYGCAGAFRPKTYGMEYRVLSNAWLKSEILQRWIFVVTKKAMRDLDEGICYQDFFGEQARDIIDGCDLNWYNQPDAPKIKGLPNPPGLAA